LKNLSQDDPIMDNPSLEDYNVDQKVDDFLAYTLDQQTKYRTSSLIMTMGSDFQYSNAHMWFKNLDKTIKYVNARQANGSRVNLLYSTPACYLHALNRANLTWPLKTDDFFPYAHTDHRFWTGYFTSRPALKFYVRQTNNILQVARQLSVISGTKGPEVTAALGRLERAMGVAQHHDAVSGTEKQHVAYDYAKRLSQGTDEVFQAFEPMLRSRFGLGPGEGIHLCPRLNISECLPVENKSVFSVFLWNPLARPVESWQRVPVTAGKLACAIEEFGVFDLDGRRVDSEVVEVDEATRRIPERVASADFEVVFLAELAPVNFTGFVFTCQNKTKRTGAIEKTGKLAVCMHQFVRFFLIKLKIIKFKRLNYGSLTVAQIICHYFSNTENSFAHIIGKN